MNDKKLENQGWIFGFAVFGIACGLLLWLHSMVADWLDPQWADLTLTIPAFFAILVVVPAKFYYTFHIRRWQCGRIGHIYENVARQNEEPLFICKHCRHVQFGETRSRTNN